jgi:hypothetical protein
LVTSKVQSSMVVSLARMPEAKAATRPRRPTPPPWTPSESSCFSRPTAPPLATFEGMFAIPRLEHSHARAQVRSSVPKPAPETLPPPPVGAPKRKPAPDTLPPEPVAALTPMVVSGTEPEPISVPALACVAEPAPVSVIVCDPSSVPMLGSLLDVRPPSVPTVPAPIRSIAPSERKPAAARVPRKTIALALGAAASLLLLVGVADSPTAAPAQPAPMHDGLLAADLQAPLSELISAWTSPQPRDAASPKPSQAQIPATTPMPSHDELLAVALPPEEVAPGLEPVPQPRRSRRARHRAHGPVTPVVETTPAPTPEPERATPRTRRPASAAQLLRAGEDALARGDAERAYRLAKRSHRAATHEDAASLVARSACRIGERDEAKRALKELPLFGRSAVRRDCRRSGSRIGL